MAGPKLMSLESALEEERKEIESLMSMQRAPSVGPRASSPFMNPRSPVRSMLDIGDGPKSPPMRPPVRSMLDIDSPPPPPRPATRSMLDIDSAVPTPTSTHTSPTLSFKAPVLDSTTRHRSMSDAASKPAPDLGLRSPPLVSPRNADPTSAYRFHEILPTNVGQALPTKRGSAGASRQSTIGEALRGSDLSNLMLPGEPGRTFAFQKNKSKSPNNRFSLRSSSPFGSASKRSQPQSKYMLDSGEIVDMNNAYRRLSDANLIYGGSSLAPLARKKPDYSDGYGRIAKDNLSPYGELLPDESDDEVANSSDEEDQRGRKLTTRAESHDNGTGAGKTAKSLLAAVEDERKQVSAVQPQYRSLFDDPSITITSPTGERSKVKTKQVVQPATSFDQEPVSGTQTPFDPDLDADVNAIKLAQNLQLSLTPIISTPEVHRSIRIIYRGEFPKIQREAEEEHRRLRKYLVATDLSDESTHALEWAIGTVLRDGDTLIAMYCMDEETSGSTDAGSLVPDDPKAMKEQAVAVHAMTKAASARPGQNGGSPSPFTFSRASNSPRIRAADGGSATSSPAPGSRGKSKTEEEREHAVLDITERVSKLLRKTQLQVRVIVEVIHCKNPKHLITEVIDLVNPTLVILGSRGRSALKGTLLGSFSNYLVTKSSVPVMVARKRLRKKSKYQPPPMKQVNNLANPSARSLETARID
ncbi:adenine nucleotide alpha hydrolases-like protein [Xylariaceae sp. FL1651]|nr:adenine nucleotide alpha hydrolases-like protein [Xylariaceae sp. FL1651]